MRTRKWAPYEPALCGTSPLFLPQRPSGRHREDRVRLPNLPLSIRPSDKGRTGHPGPHRRSSGVSWFPKFRFVRGVVDNRVRCDEYGHCMSVDRYPIVVLFIFQFVVSGFSNWPVRVHVISPKTDLPFSTPVSFNLFTSSRPFCLLDVEGVRVRTDR